MTGTQNAHAHIAASPSSVIVAGIPNPPAVEAAAEAEVLAAADVAEEAAEVAEATAPDDVDPELAEEALAELAELAEELATAEAELAAEELEAAALLEVLPVALAPETTREVAGAPRVT